MARRKFSSLFFTLTNILYIKNKEKKSQKKDNTGKNTQNNYSDNLDRENPQNVKFQWNKHSNSGTYCNIYAYRTIDAGIYSEI